MTTSAELWQKLVWCEVERMMREWEREREQTKIAKMTTILSKKDIFYSMWFYLSLFAGVFFESIFGCCLFGGTLLLISSLPRRSYWIKRNCWFVREEKKKRWKRWKMHGKFTIFEIVGVYFVDSLIPLARRSCLCESNKIALCGPYLGMKKAESAKYTCNLLISVIETIKGKFQWIIFFWNDKKMGIKVRS